MDLRCPHKKHGEVLEGIVEVRCKSRLCGARPGLIILHQFDISTGEMVGTMKLKDPNSRKENNANGSDRSSVSVRSA